MLNERVYLSAKCMYCKAPKEDKTSAKALCDVCAGNPTALAAIEQYEALRAEGYGSYSAGVMCGLY